ncbi:hypothetical protein V6N13_037519 [Hibiscus sabdariffa]
MLNFLCFQFPAAADFFPPNHLLLPPTPPSISMARTKEWRRSTTPQMPSRTHSTADIAESSQARKRKMSAGRRIQADTPSNAADESGDVAALPAPPSPAKRGRNYPVISYNNDDDDSSAHPPVA